MEKPNQIFDSPQAAKLLKNKDQVMGLMNSPDAKRLMSMLQQNNGAGLQGAAEAAMKGDPSKLMGMVQNLMNSPEGAKTVENINKNIPK